MNYIKHIVTSIEATYEDFKLVKVVPVDLNNSEASEPLHYPVQALSNINIGDIVDKNSKWEPYEKINFNDAKKATVIGADIIVAGSHTSHAKKRITFFNKDFGDKTIVLWDTDTYFYTQRGDDVLVKQIENKYKILTNITVDKLRSNSLNK